VLSCFLVFCVFWLSMVDSLGMIFVVLYWCSDVLLCGDVSRSVVVVLYPDLLLGMDSPKYTTAFCKNYGL
jgi:hypothetical protein